MSQQVVTNGGVDVINPTDTKDNEVHKTTELKPEHISTQKQPQQPPTNQPNVRHIPIFVEGRDEPLYNTNIDATTVDAPITRPPPPINDIPQPSSIFQRCKDIPVKKIVPEFEESPIARPTSPARTIPINVVHGSTNKNARQKQQQSHSQKKQSSPPQQPQQVQSSDQRCASPRPPPPPPVDPIIKIQNIQKEVLELMEKVEKYKGGSRKDKEYMYLDEMLTQNLLKLDTIDTEGKENIKAARKEAINCINKCIQVLEAKAEVVEKPQSEQLPKENVHKGDGDNDTTKVTVPPSTADPMNNTKEEKPPQNPKDTAS